MNQRVDEGPIEQMTRGKSNDCGAHCNVQRGERT